MEKCTILILAGGYAQEPVIQEGIQWRTKRKGEPSCLTFTCIKDDLLSFPEGAEVTFQYGDKHVFSGYVFEKHRNKDHHIEVTCYDRTRYFKNKENYVFTGLRADQIIARIAADLGIRIGHLTNTGYAIPKFAKADSTIWDIVKEALDLTTMATGVPYTLYDDYGSICLKSMEEMRTDCYIDQDVAEDFDYTTSIDECTYNQIVVKVDDGDPIVVEDTSENSTLAQWGLLQYVTDAKNAENARAKANALLKMHNQVSRSLGISGAFGNIEVRAGSSVYLHLSLGDKNMNQSMLVEEVTHTFDKGHHYMDLTLTDGKGFYIE